MLQTLKRKIETALVQAIATTYGDIELPPPSLGPPPSPEMGDFTFGAFPLAKPLRKSPAIIAKELAAALQLPELQKVEAVGPYLNLTLSPPLLFEAVVQSIRAPEEGVPYGYNRRFAGHKAMVEYSSPNTNKPLHVGHVRNNLLGHSICKLLGAVGYEVIRACLVNDRGIHICKSMLAYQRFFQGQTPESTGEKGDHFVGRCYVAYAQALHKEKIELKTKFEAEGFSGDELTKRVDEACTIARDAREMLRAWEAGDPEVRKLWKTMNAWVYAGFEKSYDDMGVGFDKFYYESEIYETGRAMVLEALEDGLVERREDGSIQINLDDEGLDPKILLRKDGTSLYITQDIGTAVRKYEDYQPERSIYVVGNEQDHQMRVLFTIMKRLGYSWAEGMYHLSYGMVNLPEGRMKSREGKVVDADDLLEEMVQAAREKALESARQDPRRDTLELSEEELTHRCRAVGLGAIKFFMLKTNPKKSFVFKPEESIQMQGDTGPYVQYTHARIRSISRKGAEKGLSSADVEKLQGFESLGNAEERALCRLLIDFPRVVNEAADKLLPSSIASYLVELASALNRFYHDHSVLSADSEALMAGRLALSEAVGQVLATGMDLLGIDAPEAM